MRYLQKLLSIRLNRFLLVGAGNTAVNFIVLNIAFSSLRLDKLAASMLATSCAILFSFAFNRSFVFKDSSQPVKKFIRFAAVAALGTLLIQTSLYGASVYALNKLGWTTSSIAQINIGNLIASLGVLLWNYNGYRLLVFKDKKHSDDPAEETSPEAA